MSSFTDGLKKFFSSTVFLGGLAAVGYAAVTIATGGLALIPAVVGLAGAAVASMATPSYRGLNRFIARPVSRIAMVGGALLGLGAIIAAPFTAGASLALLPIAGAAFAGGALINAASNSTLPSESGEPPTRMQRSRRFFGGLFKAIGIGATIVGLALGVVAGIAAAPFTGGASLAVSALAGVGLSTAIAGAIAGGAVVAGAAVAYAGHKIQGKIPDIVPEKPESKTSAEERPAPRPQGTRETSEERKNTHAPTRQYEAGNSNRNRNDNGVEEWKESRRESRDNLTNVAARGREANASEQNTSSIPSMRDGPR